MGLYTFLYENLLYRLYIIHIQPPLLVTARLSRYTAHTAHTAIQPYTPYIIQRHTASLRCGPGASEASPPPALTETEPVITAPSSPVAGLSLIHI